MHFLAVERWFMSGGPSVGLVGVFVQFCLVSADIITMMYQNTIATVPLSGQLGKGGTADLNGSSTQWGQCRYGIFNPFKKEI